MIDKKLKRRFKNFKYFTNDDIYFCDSVIITYEYFENGKNLGTKDIEIKIKKPMYVRHSRDWFKIQGNYCFILDQVDDKIIKKDCLELLKLCREEPKIAQGEDFASYLGKNITRVKAEYYGKMIKLDTTYENYCKLKEFEKENDN